MNDILLPVAQPREFVVDNHKFKVMRYREIRSPNMIKDLMRFYSDDEMLNNHFLYPVLALNNCVEGDLFGSTLILKEFPSGEKGTMATIVAVVSIFPVELTTFHKIAQTYDFQTAGAVTVHVRKTGTGTDRPTYVRAGLRYAMQRIQASASEGGVSRTWCVQTRDADLEAAMEKESWCLCGTRLLERPLRGAGNIWTIDL
jgi:hypothetical protein